jgi:hypothetical protein
MKVDKIISIIRALNEDVPTVSTGDSMATYDKPLSKKDKNKPTIIARGLMPGARKRWSKKG